MQNWTWEYTIHCRVLLAIPLYNLSLGKMPTKVSKQMDKVICRFVWQKEGNNRKNYALMN